MPIFSPVPGWEKLNRRLFMQNSTNATHTRQKRPRLKLNPKEYSVVRKCVLNRDGWRCQACGSTKNLQVHHMKRRNQLADDAMSNLIALCADCHGKCHGCRLAHSNWYKNLVWSTLPNIQCFPSSPRSGSGGSNLDRATQIVSIPESMLR